MLGSELDPSVWGRLPSDLHSLLIERLPLRSIARLRAVSKSWNRAWYYLVITNPNSRIKDEEWEEAAWFQILSRIPEHIFQVHLSLVCQQWNRFRRNLPAVDIMVPSFGKRNALKFIRDALDSRPGLRKVEIQYHGSRESRGNKTGIPENQVLALLQPYRMQLEEINLKLFRTRFTRMWRHAAGRFPRLVTLKCGLGSIRSPPAERTLANLKYLHFLSMRLEITALERICKLCTSLERLRIIVCHRTPEMRSDEIVTLENNTLRELMLSLEDFGVAGLALKMPQLDELFLCDCKLVHLQGSENLYRIQLPLHSDTMQIDHIESLMSLSLQRDQVSTLESLQRILKAATGLKRLSISSEFDDQQQVTLRELIPPQVEVFFYESNLIPVLESDGDHWDQVGEEVVLREGRGEEMFSLKLVTFDLKALDRLEIVERKFISILGQILRCSPSLEFIALEIDWGFGDRQWLDGALWSFRAADERLLLSWTGPGIEFFDERCWKLHRDLMLGW